MDGAPLGQTVRRCGSDVEWGLRVRRCIAAATRGPRRCPRAIPFVARGTEFAPGGSWLRGASQRADHHGMAWTGTRMRTRSGRRVVAFSPQAATHHPLTLACHNRARGPTTPLR